MVSLQLLWQLVPRYRHTLTWNRQIILSWNLLLCIYCHWHTWILPCNIFVVPGFFVAMNKEHHTQSSSYFLSSVRFGLGCNIVFILIHLSNVCTYLGFILHLRRIKCTNTIHSQYILIIYKLIPTSTYPEYTMRNRSVKATSVQPTKVRQHLYKHPNPQTLHVQTMSFRLVS